MFTVAMVEDSPEEAHRLESYVSQYAKETGTDIQLFAFTGAAPFLHQFASQFDIVFLDIELPDMNGIEIAKRIREKDSTVVLIFVTHLAQYAINGYEVSAMDYVLKPLEYSAFCLRIQRAIICCQRKEGNDITISNNNNIVRFKAIELKYVEIYQHHIMYHTVNGDYPAYGTLSKVEAGLPRRGFFRCSSSFIINLRYVDRIEGNEIIIGDARIPISRARKKEFLTEFHSFYSDME